jgi:hypothetical protein
MREVMLVTWLVMSLVTCLNEALLASRAVLTY